MVTTSSWRLAAGMAAATALAVAGVAVAATPKAGTWTARATVSGGYFGVKGASIVPVKIIAAPTDFECNTSTLVVKATKIKITKGKFSYDGPAYVDKGRAPTKLGRLVWKGTFTSTTAVKGTYRFRTSVTPKVVNRKLTFLSMKCDSGTKPWTGALTKPASGG